MRRLQILITVLVLIMASCRSNPEENITTHTVNPVARTVLFTWEIEEFTDGVFILWDDYGKMETNEANLKTEIRLLRLELSKFEKE